MSLMAHTTTSRTTEVAVRAVPEPTFTPTWHPVSHAKVIDSLESACKVHGIGIVNRDYSLNEPGTRMFGTFALDIGNGDIGYELGFRNSLDKSMVLGVTAGTRVFVCDNMCFSGSFIEFHRHTSGLDMDRLISISTKAVGGAVVEMEKLLTWQKDLNHYYVPRQDFKGLVFDMMTRGVFSSGQLSNYLSCLDEEKQLRRGYALDNATSLYNVHGAATRLMRKWNLFRASGAIKALNGLCDDYIEIKKAA